MTERKIQPQLVHAKGLIYKHVSVQDGELVRKGDLFDPLRKPTTNEVDGPQPVLAVHKSIRDVFRELQEMKRRLVDEQ